VTSGERKWLASATFLSLILCSLVFLIVIAYAGVSNTQYAITGTASLSANATVWNSFDLLGGVTTSMIFIVVIVVVLISLICLSISRTSLASL
jgi:hypothetical protein